MHRFFGVCCRNNRHFLALLIHLLFLSPLFLHEEKEEEIASGFIIGAVTVSAGGAGETDVCGRARKS